MPCCCGAFLSGTLLLWYFPLCLALSLPPSFTVPFSWHLPSVPTSITVPLFHCLPFLVPPSGTLLWYCLLSLPVCLFSEAAPCGMWQLVGGHCGSALTLHCPSTTLCLYSSLPLLLFPSTTLSSVVPSSIVAVKSAPALLDISIMSVSA